MIDVKQEGFTLLELIIVIVILGIISVSAFSRFGQEEAFALRVQQDDLLSTLSLAQQLALAGQTSVTFSMTATNYTVTTGGSDYDVGGVTFPITFKNKITSITPAANLGFDGLGRTTATTFTITAQGGDTQDVCVEATGYARAC